MISSSPALPIHDGESAIDLFAILSAPLSWRGRRARRTVEMGKSGPAQPTAAAVRSCGRATLLDHRTGVDHMTVQDSPIKFSPADLEGRDQPLPEIRRLVGNRPVVKVELPDGSFAWLVIGYEEVRQVLVDQRFSRAAAVAPGRPLPGTEMFAAGLLHRHA